MTGLILNDEDHTATLDGRPVGRVTSIIRNSYESLFGKKPYECDDDYFADRGTLAHRALHLFEKGTLDRESLSPVISPYVDGWEKCKEDFQIEVIETEFPIYDRLYWYAGVCDLRGTIYLKTVKRNFLGDHKTGTPALIDPIQLAGYGRKFINENPVRIGFYLSQNGTYKIKIYDDDEDYSVFLACVIIYNRKMRGQLCTQTQN